MVEVAVVAAAVVVVVAAAAAIVVVAAAATAAAVVVAVMVYALNPTVHMLNRGRASCRSSSSRCSSSCTGINSNSHSKSSRFSEHIPEACSVLAFQRKNR